MLTLSWPPAHTMGPEAGAACGPCTQSGHPCRASGRGSQWEGRRETLSGQGLSPSGGQAFRRKLTVKCGIWVLSRTPSEGSATELRFLYKGLWFPSSRDLSGSCTQAGTWLCDTAITSHSHLQLPENTGKLLSPSVQDKRDLRKTGYNSWFMRTCRQRQEVGQAPVHPENWGCPSPGPL